LRSKWCHTNVALLPGSGRRGNGYGEVPGQGEVLDGSLPWNMRLGIVNTTTGKGKGKCSWGSKPQACLQFLKRVGQGVRGPDPDEEGICDNKQRTKGGYGRGSN